jgi:prevent-host-death family protein
MGKMIGATAFKTHCLRILDEIERTGESVTVTKRGRPFAQVNPIAKQGRRSIIGALKGSVLKYEAPLDPAIDPQEWDANR